MNMKTIQHYSQVQTKPKEEWFYCRPIFHSQNKVAMIITHNIKMWHGP